MKTISLNIHWFIRITLAITFVLHGYPKLGTSVAQLGYIGYLIGPFEIIGGILLILGPFFNDLITKVGAAMLAIIMVGAIYMHLFKWNEGWSEIEWQVLILSACTLFIVKGNDV